MTNFPTPKKNQVSCKLCIPDFRDFLPKLQFLDENYLYVMGAASGVGKPTLCDGLLSQLLSQGFQPGQLAYIKPMTQCTAKQAVTVFCEQQQIAHRSIGSQVFKKGFTKGREI